VGAIGGAGALPRTGAFDALGDWEITDPVDSAVVADSGGDSLPSDTGTDSATGETGSDSGAASSPADPHGRDGCTYEAVWEYESPDDPLYCSGGYDAAGDDLGVACRTGTGREQDYLTSWDTSGCAVGQHYHLELEGGGSWDNVATYVCDTHANHTEGADRTVAYAPTGELEMDEDRTWTITNSYDGDLLTSAVTTGAFESEVRYAYDEAGLLVELRHSTPSGWRILTYVWNEQGNPVEMVETDEAGNLEGHTWYVYDAYGREVEAVRAEGPDDEVTEHDYTSYDAASIRAVRKAYDVGADGSIDDTDTWAWTCP
jgi:hypothetical protein